MRKRLARWLVMLGRFLLLDHKAARVCFWLARRLDRRASGAGVDVTVYDRYERG
jgi:hypothetical protein